MKSTELLSGIFDSGSRLLSKAFEVLHDYWNPSIDEQEITRQDVAEQESQSIKRSLIEAALSSEPEELDPILNYTAHMAPSQNNNAHWAQRHDRHVNLSTPTPSTVTPSTSDLRLSTVRSRHHKRIVSRPLSQAKIDTPQSLRRHQQQMSQPIRPSYGHALPSYNGGTGKKKSSAFLEYLRQNHLRSSVPKSNYSKKYAISKPKNGSWQQQMGHQRRDMATTPLRMDNPRQRLREISQRNDEWLAIKPKSLINTVEQTPGARRTRSNGISPLSTKQSQQSPTSKQHHRTRSVSKRSRQHFGNASLEALLSQLIQEGDKADFPSWEAIQTGRKAREREIRKLRRRITPLKPLDTKAEREVEQLWRRRNPSEILTTGYRIDVSVRDIQTLAPMRWLNDTIIDFYLNMITDRSKKSNLLPRSFSFNTHFFTTLRSRGYDAVGRWAKRKGVNVTELDYIFVPVNLHNSHWCLAVINRKLQRFEYYDSIGGNPESNTFSLLRQYLQKETAKYRTDLVDKISNYQEYIAKDSPLQSNGHDCGVFTCRTVEVLSRNGDFDFTQAQMNLIRSRMTFEIVNQKLLS